MAKRTSKGTLDRRPATFRPIESAEAWDWKEDPVGYVRALFSPFGVRIRARDIDDEAVEVSVETLAALHGLRLYEFPAGAGGDAYSYILSSHELTQRQLESLEAIYFGDPEPWPHD